MRSGVTSRAQLPCIQRYCTVYESRRLPPASKIVKRVPCVACPEVSVSSEHDALGVGEFAGACSLTLNRLDAHAVAIERVLLLRALPQPLPYLRSSAASVAIAHALSYSTGSLMLSRPRRYVMALWHQLLRGVLIAGLGTVLNSCAPSKDPFDQPQNVIVDLDGGESVAFLARDGEALYQVISGVIAPAGVVIAERSSHSIGFYDSAGTLRWALGRDGDGPGDFRDILWVRRLADRIAVYDPTLRRVTDVGFDGELRQVRIVELPEDISGADLMGSFADGSGLAAALRHNFPPTGIGAYRHRVAAYRFEIGRDRADSLFSMLAEEQFVLRGRPNFFGPIPYGAQSWISVSDSVAYATDNSSATVSAWSMAGTLLGEIRIPRVAREPVSQSDVASARERFRATTTRARVDWMRFFDAMPIPDSMPFFGWGGVAPIKPLVATSDGYLFVTLYGGARASATRIAVVDPQRRYLGTLMFDVEARVLDAQGGAMLVQAWDADGVESVRLVPFPFGRTSASH